jgi:hypothetical protein
MSRSVAQKRIHYVRAIYSAHPGKSLEQAIRLALSHLKKVTDTEVSHPSLGVLEIRHRDLKQPDFVRLAIGVGVPNESMSTLGIGVAATADSNHPTSPPSSRAFKLSDAFCLIDGDDLLVCTDGSVRLPALNMYLSQLLGKANATPASQAFELRARLNANRTKTLEAEGIKELKISATAYSAHVEDGNSSWLRAGWQHMIEQLRDAFEKEVKTDAEREAIAKHWGELNISATIGVKGGTRGEPVVVKSLGDIARDAIDDAPDGTDVVLVTGRGNHVGAQALTLGRTVSIKRLNKQNDLDYTDAWNKLESYRQELKETKRWKK